jgi:hypothetical protein
MLRAFALFGIILVSGCTGGAAPTPTPTVVASLPSPLLISIVPSFSDRNHPHEVRLGQLVDMRIPPGGIPNRWDIPTWMPKPSLRLVTVSKTNRGGLDAVFSTLREGRVVITTSACIPDPCAVEQATIDVTR